MKYFVLILSIILIVTGVILYVCYMNNENKNTIETPIQTSEYPNSEYPNSEDPNSEYPNSVYPNNEHMCVH